MAESTPPSPPTLHQVVLPSWSGDGEDEEHAVHGGMLNASLLQSGQRQEYEQNQPLSSTPAPTGKFMEHETQVNYSNKNANLSSITSNRMTRDADAFSSSSEESEDSSEESSEDSDSDSGSDDDDDDEDTDESSTDNENAATDSFDINHKEIGSPAEIDAIEQQNKVDAAFVQKAESLVLGEIMEHSSIPLPSPTKPKRSESNQSITENKKSLSASSSFSKESLPTNAGLTSNSSTSNKANTSLPGASSEKALRTKDEALTGGMIPDVLITMRQKIESLTLFDSDMIGLSESGKDYDDFEDEEARRTKESLRRTFQQSISASVLVSLSHKRYERRRNAAMEIEKVIRNLVQEKELERVRAILILLSDDYVRSTSEDSRKGGVVALAACGIGLKKADENDPNFTECKDLILASVVHACQDHNQRVRYYATESLFNVIKVLQQLAVKHFFILFEILRSLYADVDIDVRSGAQLLDKKLKEIIIAAINNGSYTIEACIPLFSRFVQMRNKPTKRLTLTWLQEFSEKLLGSPLVGFLHLFLGGVFAMLADPNPSIRQGSLIFLETILPQLLENNDDFEENEISLYVDFDKILQNLVTTMEHPNPFVRKVAMYWMSRIIQTHMVDQHDLKRNDGLEEEKASAIRPQQVTTAAISVRNSLPHVLPGVLLSIGDQFNNRSATKDMFLPGMTTRGLADQTNEYFQKAVKRDGKSYVSLLDGFIVALREEIDSPGGLATRNPAAIERQPYRLDVKSDGTGIESTGWFRSSDGNGKEADEAVMMSRICALEWVITLYEFVVPHSLKAEYAKEFISPIIHQLLENPPEEIVIKSFEVLARITTPSEGESKSIPESEGLPVWAKKASHPPYKRKIEKFDCEVMNEGNVDFALDVMDNSRKKQKSRDREVFGVLIHLYSRHHRLLADLARVIKIMCKLQPAEFVFVSFAIELDNFVSDSWKRTMTAVASEDGSTEKLIVKQDDFARDLEFASAFVQQLSNVLLIAPETSELRLLLLDSIGKKTETEDGERRAVLFQILLQTFAHNLAATLSLCLWGGAFMTLSCCFESIDPMDMNLLFYLELDHLIEMLERPIFRHLHLCMLEADDNPFKEGSGTMLFRTLKSILMLLPQSTSYDILKDRLLAVSKFRQCTIIDKVNMDKETGQSRTILFIERIKEVRKMHCDAKWRAVRAESLEPVLLKPNSLDVYIDENEGRREWLGYADEKDEIETKERMAKLQTKKIPSKDGYNEFHDIDDDQCQWKSYWVHNGVE